MLTMRLEGADQLAKVLHELPTRLSRKVQREALTKAAAPIRSVAATTVRRAGGDPDLADHLTVSPGRSKVSDEVVVKVGPTKQHRSDQQARTFDQQAFYLEFGTIDTAPQPFMATAFGQASAAIPIAIGELWRGLIARGFGVTRGSSGVGR